MRFFCLEHFFQDSAQEKWDVIKLVLRQPHARNKQMGIDFVRIGSLNNSKKKKIVEKVCLIDLFIYLYCLQISLLNRITR